MNVVQLCCERRVDQGKFYFSLSNPRKSGLKSKSRRMDRDCFNDGGVALEGRLRQQDWALHSLTLTEISVPIFTLVSLGTTYLRALSNFLFLSNASWSRATENGHPHKFRATV
jgi:hypothetical protein